MFKNFFGQSANQPAAGAGTTVPTTPPSASGADATIPSPASQAVKDGKMPGTDQLPPNPLDLYAKLWETSNEAPEVAPAFNLDPKVLDNVSGTLDFTKAVSPELMQKAIAGDMTALMQVMNHVGQQSYKAALAHSTSLTDKFVDARAAFDLKGVGSKVKSELAANAMASIPNYSHPAVKAEVTRIAQAMQKQNPDASPDEIATATKAYFVNVYAAINPSASTQEAEGNSAATNWDKYFG